MNGALNFSQKYAIFGYFNDNKNALIENKVDVARKQSEHALIDDLGMISEVILHTLCPIFRIDDNGILHNDRVFFLYNADHVKAPVLAALDLA